MPTKASDLGIPAGKWTVDQAHSSVEFIVRHLMVSKVRGSFKTFTAEVVIADNIEDSSVTATIEAESITTRDDNRDAHLRSADFFEVEKYPQITFKSTSLTRKGDDWAMIGDLTIKDVTHPIELTLEFNGTQQDTYGNLRAGVSASGQLSREQWGLSWNAALETGGVMVGDKVTLEIEVEMIAPTAS